MRQAHTFLDSSIILTILTARGTLRQRRWGRVDLNPKVKGMGGNSKRYRTYQVCKLYDVSRATLFRWEREGLITEPPRDWRNWRTYTNENIKQIKRLMRSRNAGR